MHIKPLTSIRFFAALLIFFHHLIGNIWIVQPERTLIVLGQGVSLFFVLSGFILHYSYRAKLCELGAARFLALRFFRLWPVHVAAILFVVAIFPWALRWFENNLAIWQVTAVVLLVHAWIPDMKTIYSINAPSWSISTEMAFYAFFPFAVPWIRRDATRSLLAITALTLAWLVGVQIVTSSAGTINALVGINPVPRVLEFASGIALCEWLLRRNTPRQHSRLVWTAIECGAIASCGLLMLASVPLSSLLRETLGMAFAQYATVAGAFPAFAALIGVLYLQRGYVSKVLSWPVWVHLGEWSFAFYLFHQPAIRWWKRYIPHDSIPLAGQVLILFSVITGVSALVHVMVEKPCHSLAKRIFDTSVSARATREMSSSS